ncbi:hypothetical protein Glove_290g6 [Diversispora epigaea]|uniref:Crinkler effector protein N-terminal domain-containing protein n=1 Tax=Diversispora epigaea TaxID=1348612 RepID=A0A397I4F9_9GLOM|nr:hypothetical protein Glove_290g6 [Diversispora epigaea]
MYIKLFCLIKGDSARHAFPVKIDRDDTIGDLKKAIKAEKPNDFFRVDADKLRLWKEEIPDDKDDLLSVLSLQDEDELFSTRDIEFYWTDTPKKKHIHVIIKQPVSMSREISSVQEILSKLGTQGLPYFIPTRKKQLWIDYMQYIIRIGDENRAVDNKEGQLI